MFEQAVLSTGPASKRVWTTFAGVTGQALLVTFAVMVPMVWPEAMPGHQALLKIFIPGTPPGRPLKGDAAAPARMTHAIPKQWDGKGLRLPARAPDRVVMIDEPPDTGLARGSQIGVIGGSETGSPDGIFAGLGASTAVIPARPKDEPHAAATAPAPEPAIKRYTVGGNVHLGTLQHRVEPVYPRLAAMARVSGVVELIGVVGIDGRIRELRVKSGHPLLTQAAIDAVRQWIYEPTTLNGDKVEIIAPITVTFRLN